MEFIDNQHNKSHGFGVSFWKLMPNKVFIQFKQACIEIKSTPDFYIYLIFFCFLATFSTSLSHYWNLSRFISIGFLISVILLSIFAIQAKLLHNESNINNALRISKNTLLSLVFKLKNLINLLKTLITFLKNPSNLVSFILLTLFSYILILVVSNFINQIFLIHIITTILISITNAIIILVFLVSFLLVYKQNKVA